MRGLQGSFSRLKSRITSRNETRYKLIYSILVLHDLRVARVGLNQIAIVFNPHYQQYINIHGYDRIARFYEHELND